MKPDPRYRGERVYVVVWPEHMIVKAGYTSQTRWRSFMGRGAFTHQLTLFGTFWDAFEYEGELHRYFRRRAPFAFSSNVESRWLLGPLSGCCETYLLPDWSVLDEMPRPDPARIVYCPNFEYLTRPVDA